MSYIYFIQAEGSGPIKIGFTTGTPNRRVVVLQTGCPWPITLLGAIEGTLHQEKQFHLALAPWRTQGEWFEPHPVVIAAVSEALKLGRAAPNFERQPLARRRVLCDPASTHTSFSKIIDAFGGCFAHAIGIEESHARVMKVRDSIPSTRWRATVVAADQMGVPGITLELLARLDEQKKSQASG